MVLDNRDVLLLENKKGEESISIVITVNGHLVCRLGWIFEDGG